MLGLGTWLSSDSNSNLSAIFLGKQSPSWREGRLGSKARHPRLHTKTACLLRDNQRSQGMNSGLKKTKANLLGLEGQFSKNPVFFSHAPLIFLYNPILIQEQPIWGADRGMHPAPSTCVLSRKQQGSTQGFTQKPGMKTGLFPSTDQRFFLELQKLG